MKLHRIPRYLALLSILVVVSGFGLVWGQAPSDPPTDDERLLLPPFCKAGWFAGDHPLTPGPESKRWMEGFGDDLWHNHHYCQGLVFFSRAQRTRYSAADRNGLYERSIGEFNYMIKNTKPEFVLRPEIYSKIGLAYLGLRKFSDAERAFSASAKTKEDYWPAYAGLADVAYGRKDKAALLKWSEAGLRFAPGNARLLELKRLASTLNK